MSSRGHTYEGYDMDDISSAWNFVSSFVATTCSVTFHSAPGQYCDRFWIMMTSSSMTL